MFTHICILFVCNSVIPRNFFISSLEIKNPNGISKTVIFPKLASTPNRETGTILWPAYQAIPYEIDERFSFGERYWIENAMRILSARLLNCITFKRRKRELRHIFFNKNDRLLQSSNIGYKKDSRNEVSLTSFVPHVNVYYPLFCALGLLGNDSDSCAYRLQGDIDNMQFSHYTKAEDARKTGLTINDILQLQYLYNCSIPEFPTSMEESKLVLPRFTYHKAGEDSIQELLVTLHVTNVIKIIPIGFPIFHPVQPIVRQVSIASEAPDSALEQIFQYINKSSDSLPITLRLFDQPIYDASFSAIKTNITAVVLLGYVRFFSTSLRQVALPMLVHFRFENCESIYLYKNDLAGFPRLRMFTAFNSSFAEIHEGAFNGLTMLQLLVLQFPQYRRDKHSTNTKSFRQPISSLLRMYLQMAATFTPVAATCYSIANGLLY